MTSSKLAYRNYREEHGFLGQKKAGKQAERNPQDTSGDHRRKLPYYLKRYFRTVWKYKRHIITLLSLSIASLLFSAVNPWTGKFMLDYIFAPLSAPSGTPHALPAPLAHLSPQRLLVTACLLLALVAICEILLKTASEYVVKVLSAKMEVGIRRKLIQHLQLMSLAKIEHLKTGGIISRLEGDVNNFSGLLYQGALAPLKGLFMFAIGLGSLLFISPAITLVCLLFIILIAGSAYLMFNVMRPLFRDLHEDLAHISAKLGETFGGIRIVRIFGREASETAGFITAHNLLIRKTLHTEKLNIATRRTFDVVSWTMDITIWLVGGLAALRGDITVGDLIVFTRFSKWFFHPVFLIMHNISQVQNSIACTERIIDMLDEPVDIIDGPDAKPAEPPTKQITLKNLTFAYDPQKPVLKNLSLTLPVGKTTALVGASGAGKTALINLLVRFYEPTEGSIEIDGIPIQNLKIKSYRNLFALVPQEVQLFDGTISQNIAFSKPGATDQEIREAAIIAAAHDFIMACPGHYQALIGERGIRLSGGQRQRISLARAIIKKPNILILDEATSSLDSNNEKIIQNALKDILRNRTTLVIAHRLSTIVDADQIAVLKDGAIAELGTHEQLMRKQGIYATMYEQQTRAQELKDQENIPEEEEKKGLM